MQYSVQSILYEPIELQAAKEHIRTVYGDTSEDETIIKPLIATAREFAENVTGKAFAKQTIVARTAAWGNMQLPRLPVLSVEKVTYWTEDNQEKELEPSKYRVDVDEGIVYILHAPEDKLAEGNPIRVHYTAGGQTTETARQAMLLLIGHWYNNREAVVVGSATSVEVGLTAKTLLNQNKGWWF